MPSRPIDRRDKLSYLVNSLAKGRAQEAERSARSIAVTNVINSAQARGMNQTIRAQAISNLQKHLFNLMSSLSQMSTR